VSADDALRAVPQPSELTADFWSAARRRELVRPVCDVCGRSHFSPQVCCPHCLSEDWSYVRSSGRGVVYSATTAHRAPLPGFAPPYRVAIVDLEEGWSMLANLVGDAPAAIGTPVEVTWIELPTVTLPAFTPESPEVPA
jgi:uncharacterized protein